MTMKNKKDTSFTVNYRVVKRTNKGGVKHIYSNEYFCCGGGFVMITSYSGLMKNGKIVKSHLRNSYRPGGYKLAYNLFANASNKYDEYEEHTNVI